jgi:hypothetical protein
LNPAADARPFASDAVGGAQMPESYGKKKRRDVKSRKAADREERRVARNQRRSDRAAGLIEKGPPVEAADPTEYGLPAVEAESEA